jgi:two-component system osmolarity sensor histidine kinase EnvZ
MAESHLQSIRAALTLIPEDKRRSYLEQLGKNDSLHLQTESPIASISAQPPSFAIQKFLQNFEKKNKSSRASYLPKPTCTSCLGKNTG